MYNGMQSLRLPCREQTYIRAERLEEPIWSEVKRVIQNPDLIVAGIDTLDSQEGGGLVEETAQAERDLRSIQMEEDRAIRLFVSGKITETQLDHQRRFITERLESARAKLDDYRAQEASGAEKRRLMEAVLAWAREVGQGLDELTPEQRRIKRYGFEEHTVGKPDDEAVEDGRNSRRRKYRKVVRERPGLVPSALFHIIGNTVFLRLADVASGLPPYEEQVMLSSMDSEEDATGYSQRSAYNTVYEELRLKLAEALKAGSKRLLATYLQTLLAYPDGCTRGETVFDPRSGDVIVQVPLLGEGRLYPKEKALIDMVAAERMEGRRVLVYATHTGTRDITGRMDDMLTRHGFRVAVMKADAVAPERREAWVADRVKEGIDVMICHPRLVQTGLDLIDFPTLIWYETDYSVYVMRQAPRRSWRIGQTRPVKVVFMSYKNTLQADALKLVAKKLQSSLAVEGELPEDALAAYGDDGDDLMMALARKIVSGEEDDAETVEDVLAQARDTEAASEEFLVDDGWKVVEVEPEAAPVNGNGHHADGIGPTVELVLGNGHHANGNGHAAVEVNGNGHHDEAPEPQQTLFSWAEFMAEEPVKPKGRGRKPQPAATSLFEWALEMEQEREEEPVGAGR